MRARSCTCAAHLSFGWGYGLIPVIGAVVAIGGGLHVAAYYLEGESVLDASATVL